MPRAARKAPVREPEPLDDYSTWDIRTAKVIFYGFILSTVVLVAGIWAVILGWAFDKGFWDWWVDRGLAFQFAIISGAITGHLILLVLFYTLFRGGMVKLCKVLFKDRRLAKKWEDYTTLRLLIGVTLYGVYFTLLSLFIGILPYAFLEAILRALKWMVENFGLGLWILFAGAMILLIVIIIFLGFSLWNHGVFWILKHVKTIEEEMEVEERIKKEALKEADERTLQSVYKKETGKKALHRGKETKGYIEWKKKQMLK